MKNNGMFNTIVPARYTMWKYHLTLAKTVIGEADLVKERIHLARINFTTYSIIPHSDKYPHKIIHVD